MPSLEFLAALRRLVSKIEDSLPELKEPVKMYIAGGTAVHYYTATRFSDDVDATFSKRLLLPDDLQVSWVADDGKARILYIDKQYNDTFALMHENYDVDAIPCAEINAGKRKVLVYFLSPVDLAVSKLSRYEGMDQDDIKGLADRGLVTSASVRTRAKEALGGYIGDMKKIRNSIELACKLINKAQRVRGTGATSR